MESSPNQGNLLLSGNDSDKQFIASLYNLLFCLAIFHNYP